MIKLNQREEDFLSLLQSTALTGYTISKAFSEVGGGARRVSLGGIYPTLLRLEWRGLVTSFWSEEIKRGDARRRFYQLTTAGEQALEEAQAYRQALAEWGKGEVFYG